MIRNSKSSISEATEKTYVSRFERLFEGIKNTLRNEGEFFSELSQHHGEKGRLNESHLKRVLVQCFGVGTGFIVSNKTFPNTLGPQIDIVIYDAINNAPIYQSDAFGIYPIEMVYAYIEVKTTLRMRDIAKVLKINSEIRELANTRKYRLPSPEEAPGFTSPPPRFYLFAYRSNDTCEKTEKKLREGFARTGSAHAHGIYVLDGADGDFLISRVPYKEGAELFTRRDLAFPMFLNSIGAHCSMMVPIEMSGFYLTDLSAYFP